MQAFRHCGRVALVATLVVVSVAISGCGWFGTEPERRARAFVEALVSEPAKLELLQGFVMGAPGVDPLAFTREPPMHVALEYLRSRHRSGDALDFSAYETARPNLDTRRVAVRVRIGAERPATDEVMFRVELERERGGTWLVTHTGVLP